MSGMIGSMLRLFANYKSKYIHLIINQFFICCFVIVCLFYVINFDNFLAIDKKAVRIASWFNKTALIIVIVALSIFFLLIEGLVFFLFFKRSPYLIIFLYTSLVPIFSVVL